VKILYFYFAKAFDTVSIPKPLYKLDRYGINNKVVADLQQ